MLVVLDTEARDILIRLCEAIEPRIIHTHTHTSEDTGVIRELHDQIDILRRQNAELGIALRVHKDEAAVAPDA